MLMYIYMLLCEFVYHVLFAFAQADLAAIETTNDTLAFSINQFLFPLSSFLSLSIDLSLYFCSSVSLHYIATRTHALAFDLFGNGNVVLSSFVFWLFCYCCCMRHLLVLTMLRCKHTNTILPYLSIYCILKHV